MPADLVLVYELHDATGEQEKAVHKALGLLEHFKWTELHSTWEVANLDPAISPSQFSDEVAKQFAIIVTVAKVKKWDLRIWGALRLDRLPISWPSDSPSKP